MRVAVKVSNLIPGSRLVRSVYSEYGALLLREGVVLTRGHLESLHRQGVREVYVEVVDDLAEPSITAPGPGSGSSEADQRHHGAETTRSSHESSPSTVADAPKTGMRPDSEGGSPLAVPELELEKRHFQETYRAATATVENVMRSGRLGQFLPASEVREAAEAIAHVVHTTHDVLALLVRLRQASDPTFTHSVNVALVAALLGRWLKLSEGELRVLAQAGMMHDVGKAQIPEPILSKQEPLTPDEIRIIRQHPLAGYELLSEVSSIPEQVRSAVLQHHERGDGSGYPYGLTGAQIAPFSRLVAIADVYAAMSAERPYRRRVPHFRIAEHLHDESFSRLDPQFVRVFLDHVASFYVGSQVRLSDGQVGQVVFIDDRHPTRPLVKVGEDFISLQDREDLAVEDILSL